jgi:hypothetical protein
MKKIFTLLTAVLLSAFVFAQSPQKMSYQAVIRNASNNLVTSATIGMRISILQGSANGISVYVEKQTTSTNTNGLVSIEMGSGSVLSGAFTTIDWANGPYFIKTETDPTGGANYTITGTSQLLSVPYALHAKTAESVSGTITETDPIYLASQAKKIISTDITNLSNLSGINTGDQDLSNLATKKALSDSISLLRSKIPTDADGSETKITAGTNITVTGTGTTTSPYVVNANDLLANKRYVGELYGGGVVFWVDHTGNHGLICSMIDISTTQIIWSNVNIAFIGATNLRKDWDGQGNTNAIIGQANHTKSAAKICNDYTNIDYGTGIFSDWYLPSIAELNQIWNNFYEVQKALTIDGNNSIIPLYNRLPYWSSTEGGTTDALAFSFFYGYTINFAKDEVQYVRAVRVF